MKTIRIAHLYYDLMNLYGENGNVRYLVKKLQDQQFNVEIHFLSLDDDIKFDKYDIFYIGTGSEKNQKLVIQDLMKYKKDINKAILDDKYFIATGNALEMFAKKISYLDGSELKCLGFFNYICKEEEFRIVGEQFYECNFIPEKIIGFQNRLSVIENFENSMFEVIKGCGYNPAVKKEGIYKNNFFGTYLLGPILVRNPYFTDYIVKNICNDFKTKYIEPNLSDASYLAYSEYINNFHNKKEVK